MFLFVCFKLTTSGILITFVEETADFVSDRVFVVLIVEVRVPLPRCRFDRIRHLIVTFLVH